MLPMRSMVLSKSKPWKRLVMEVPRQFGVAKDLRMVLAQIFASRDKKPRRAAGRIAEDVGRLRRDHLDHEPDDVARRAKLAVLTGGRDLAEHVLVEVALGVALLHRHLVDHITTFASRPAWES